MSRFAVPLALLLIIGPAAPTVFADPLDVLGNFDPSSAGFEGSLTSQMARPLGAAALAEQR